MMTTLKGNYVFMGARSGMKKNFDKYSKFNVYVINIHYFCSPKN